MAVASCRLSNTTPTHVGSLSTESTNIYRWKTSVIDAYALCVEPVITRFAIHVSYRSMDW